MLKYCFRTAICLLVFCSIVQAAGKQYTAEDYRKGYNFYNSIRGKVYNDNIQFHWLKDKEAFWYASQAENYKRYTLFDVQSSSKSDLFDHNKLAEILAETSGHEINAANLPIHNSSYDDSSNTLSFTFDEAKWEYNTESDSIVKLESDDEQDNSSGRRRRDWGRGADNKDISPDGNWQAFTKNYQLWLKDTKTEEEYCLTDNGKAERYYDNSFYWSGDSKKLVCLVVEPSGPRKVHYIESSPEDQLQPKHFTIDYDKPGDKITTYKPAMFDIDSQLLIPVSDELFSNPYNIDDFHWLEDSSAFYFYYNQRGHQVGRVLRIDANSGEVTAIVDESSDTFIDYSSKKYLRYLDKSQEIIWSSERDGWNQLYLYDMITGEVKNQITKGDWVWRWIVDLDEENRELCFTASGYYPDQDPYFIHYFKVNFDGSGLKAYTVDNGTHKLEFSPDGAYYIDRFSRVDLPPVYQLRQESDGGLICELEKSDASALFDAGWPVTEPFTAKSRDDKYDIWGIIHRPVDLDPTKKYPVIEDIYAGPHSNHVPKAWKGCDYWHQALCDLGFIVVQIDGMGTSNRCREFHHLAWKNLADAGFPDRIKWIKAAAKKYPYMDIEHVGIYGTSAGGQNAMGALLFHPEFYKAAVASCGCHDNRMDKIWWNEQWMGWPVDESYAKSSNVDNAYKLEGDLLLFVGELDRNVDPASTMQVVNALIKANKNFEMLYVPGMGHSAGGKYGERKRRDFFIEHLRGDIPVDWNKVPKDMLLP